VVGVKGVMEVMMKVADVCTEEDRERWRCAEAKEEVGRVKEVMEGESGRYYFVEEEEEEEEGAAVT